MNKEEIKAWTVLKHAKEEYDKMKAADDFVCRFSDKQLDSDDEDEERVCSLLQQKGIINRWRTFCDGTEEDRKRCPMWKE